MVQPSATLVPRLDILGAALADGSRARILCELMDGRAFTNKELAAAAGIAPSTATAHLQQLEAVGLTQSVRSGRCVYHRIASEPVAAALEQLSHLTPADAVQRHPRAHADLRQARSCYNHIAGRLGVALTDRLLATGVVVAEGAHLHPGAGFASVLAALGITAPAQRPVAKLCLDWTERRFHLSGPLATALMTRALDAGWLTRTPTARVLHLTPAGAEVFATVLGLPPLADASVAAEPVPRQKGAAQG